MTQINFDFSHLSADGVAVLADEPVHVVPTKRFKVGSRIVVRDSFEVRLDEHGTATVTVPPTDSTFAYEVTVGEKKDTWRFVRVVQVPNSQTPVKFADLVDVDPATLIPTTIVSPLTELTDEDIDWISQFVVAGTNINQKGAK